MQMKELVNFFNGLNERCFMDCVYNFKTRKITASEKQCIASCVSMSLQASARMTRVYAEQQILMAQEQQAKADAEANKL